MVDGVGHGGVEVPEWVVRQPREVNDGVKSNQINGRGVSNVLSDFGDILERASVRASAEEIAVETCNFNPLGAQ